jgi:hypothetical protein
MEQEWVQELLLMLQQQEIPQSGFLLTTMAPHDVFLRGKEKFYDWDYYPRTSK